MLRYPKGDWDAGAEDYCGIDAAGALNAFTRS